MLDKTETFRMVFLLHSEKSLSTDLVVKGMIGEVRDEEGFVEIRLSMIPEIGETNRWRQVVVAEEKRFKEVKSSDIA